MNYCYILLAFLPVCAGLDCYVCSSGMAGCNDPFDATAYNVTTLSLTTNIFCVVIMLFYFAIKRHVFSYLENNVD
jgi:hypothetical protein